MHWVAFYRLKDDLAGYEMLPESLQMNHALPEWIALLPDQKNAAQQYMTEQEKLASVRVTLKQWMAADEDERASLLRWADRVGKM